LGDFNAGLKACSTRPVAATGNVTKASYKLQAPSVCSFRRSGSRKPRSLGCALP